MMEKQQQEDQHQHYNYSHHYHNDDHNITRIRSNSLGLDGGTTTDGSTSSNWDAEEGHLLSFFFNNHNSNSTHALIHNHNNDDREHYGNVINRVNNELEQQQQALSNYHSQTSTATNGKINYSSTATTHNSSSSPTSIRDRCIPNMYSQNNTAIGIDLPSVDRYYTEISTYSNKPRSTSKIKQGTTKENNINQNKNIILQQQQQLQSISSNIEPRPMINNEIYNKMMLPPPPRFAFNNTTTTPISNNEDSNMQQKAHLEWLKSMNELASKQQSAASFTAAAASPLIAPIPLPTQIPQQPIQTAAAFTNNIQQTPSSILLPASNINYSNVSQPPPPQVNTSATKTETEERRLRRLARNRESARQSRRRKKELLETLGNKVNDKYKELEDERRNQVNSMVPDLQSLRHGNIQRLHSSMIEKNNNIKKIDEEKIYQSLTQQHEHDMKKEITLYQYERLKTLVLPTPSQYALWLLNSNPISFFQIAKETAIKQNNLMNSTRISSKQIGEKYVKSLEQQDNYECESSDSKLYWPYFCNELSISVDQEERIVALYRNVQKQIEKENLERIRKTQHIVYSLKQIMLQKSQQNNNLQNILTKDQYIRYLKWRLDNKSKCNNVIQNMMKGDENGKDLMKESYSSSVEKDTEQQKEDNHKSLDELCRRLSEALNVSTGNYMDETNNGSSE